MAKNETTKKKATPKEQAERQRHLKALGQAIKSLRAEKALPQDQLADAAGISRTSMSNIETGQQDLRFTSFLRVCKELNVSPQEFFDRYDRCKSE